MKSHLKLNNYPSHFYRVLISLGCCAAFSCPAITWHQDMTEQDSIDLAWSEPAFNATCRIFVRNDDGRLIQTGTGVLIADEWVLTARHLFIEKSKKEKTRVLFQRTADSDFTRRSIKAVFTTSPDLALIQLREPAPDWVPRIHPYLKQDEFSAQLEGYKIGYGATDSKGTGMGIRRGCTNRYTKESEEWLWFVKYRSHSAKFTKWEGGTGPADSGGPFFVKDNGTWWVSSLTQGPHRGVGFRETRLSTKMDWIRQTTGIAFDGQIGGAE